MKYTYDCSGQSGGTGNFIVNEDAGNDSTSSAVAINNLDAGQTGTWNVYGDAGGHYLKIETECPYTIHVLTVAVRAALCGRPPAQIPACRTTALGSHLG